MNTYQTPTMGRPGVMLVSLILGSSVGIAGTLFVLMILGRI